MSFQRYDLDDIKRRLADNIDAMMRELFPNAVAAGNHWYMGSVAGEPGRSLVVWRKGRKAGEWCDFAVKTGDAGGGGPLGLAIAAFGGDRRRGIEWAAFFTGVSAVSHESEAERAAREERARRQRLQKERDDAANLAKVRRAAMHHFISAAPIADTPADRYLLGRALDIRRLGRQPGALRFKQMQCPETGLERPCMLASVVAVTGELLTVHRTFLFELPDGRVVKASDKAVPEELRMEEAKQAFCEYAGGHIPLWRGASGKPAKAMPDGEWIAGTEGAEDGLSIAIAAPDRRIWALLALSNLSRAGLPAQCGGLYWHRHRGDHPEAVKQYERERERLTARGVSLRELWAPGDFKDFNEWAQAEMLKTVARAGAEA